LSQTLVELGTDTVQAANQAEGTLSGMLQKRATMRAFVDVCWVLGVVFRCVAGVIS
jgi:hypothetical protein